MSKRHWKLGAIGLVFAFAAAACPAAGDDNLLQEVMDRGVLRCGVNDAVPGFGFRTSDGDFEGFDVDFCRVVAAAVLGDATAVEFTPLTTEARFTALQAGEVDVLIRNTTWTAGRDGGESAAFATTTFYDAQDMLVRADSAFQSLEDMAGTTICVLSGTTTEANLEDEFNFRGLDYEPLTFEERDVLDEAFREERCAGWTSDRSQLFAHRGSWPDADGGPAALRVLGETLSKEPLGPAVLDGDSQWFDAVNWAVMATMQAEEFEITSENVDEIRSDPPHPGIGRFLGATEVDPGLGLPEDFAYQVVSQVGNYAEIFERNLGAGTPVDITERGPNALWTDGGLLYPPPYR